MNKLFMLLCLVLAVLILTVHGGQRPCSSDADCAGSHLACCNGCFRCGNAPNVCGACP